MMKVVIGTILLFGAVLNSSFVYGSDKLSAHLKLKVLGDLDSIIKRKYIRILTTRNIYDYYIFQGQKKGLQYEMANEFTKHLNKKFTKKDDLPIAFELIPTDFDQLIPMLLSGQGDVIAVGLTKTPERQEKVEFTTPYQVVDEVIVTRKDLADKWQDKTFHIQANSSFSASLKSKGIKFEQVNKNFHSGEIMQFISLGKFDYSLVNSFWAKTITKTFENLKVIKDIPFRKKIDIAWAVRKEDTKLLAELNNFLPKIKKGTLLGNLLSFKYFHNLKARQSKVFDVKNSVISQYDETLKKYAKKYGWDWRLLAAVGFQESRFDQSIHNKWGAIGIFQIKQMTANEPYINIPTIEGVENFENNIHAGVKYLSWLKKTYFDKKENIKEEDKIRMTLAAYNAGPGRLLQAVKKTKELGLNPNVWFRNVEHGMLKLGVDEPTVYVSEINKHYVSYLLLGIK